MSKKPRYPRTLRALIFPARSGKGKRFSCSRRAASERGCDAADLVLLCDDVSGASRSLVVFFADGLPRERGAAFSGEATGLRPDAKTRDAEPLISIPSGTAPPPATGSCFRFDLDDGDGGLKGDPTLRIASSSPIYSLSSSKISDWADVPFAFDSFCIRTDPFL